MKPNRCDPIAAALKEDIGDGDVTTDFFVPEKVHATGRIVVREKAVVAGTGAAAEVFRQVDPATDVQINRRDGDDVGPDDVIIEVRGFARSVLRAERFVLNFMQPLCGIATLTREFVNAVGNHSAKILDTRKTTPGLRALEKAAVLAGGGVNHRFGLYDMVLVKDNHLATLGDLSNFAERICRLRQERPADRCSRTNGVDKRCDSPSRDCEFKRRSGSVCRTSDCRARSTWQPVGIGGGEGSVVFNPFATWDSSQRFGAAHDLGNGKYLRHHPNPVCARTSH